MAFLCPARRKSKKTAKLGLRTLDTPFPGRITGSASIDTLVRVGLEKEHGPRARMLVIHDFTPCVDDEIDVKRGQHVSVLYQENDWLYVIAEDGREGFVPYTYCLPAKKTNGQLSNCTPTNTAPIVTKQLAEPITTILEPPIHAQVKQELDKERDCSKTDRSNLQKSSSRSMPDITSGCPAPSQPCNSDSDSDAGEQGKKNPLRNPYRDRRKTSASVGVLRSSHFSYDKRYLHNKSLLHGDQQYLQRNHHQQQQQQQQYQSRHRPTQRSLPSTSRSRSASSSATRSRASSGHSSQASAQRQGQGRPQSHPLSQWVVSQSGDSQRPQTFQGPSSNKVRHLSEGSRHFSENTRRSNIGTTPYTQESNQNFSEKTRSTSSGTVTMDTSLVSEAPNVSTVTMDTSLVSEAPNVSTMQPFQKFRKGRYIILFQFIAQEEDDLSVERGEFVTVLNTDDPKWFWVKRSDFQEGFVPSNFLCPAQPQQTQGQTAGSSLSTSASQGKRPDLVATAVKEATPTTIQSTKTIPPANQSTKLVCIYDFQARVPGDLSVKRGQWLVADMDEQPDKDWLWVHSLTAKQSGYIPRTYAKPPNFGMDFNQYENMRLRSDVDPFVCS